MRWISLVKTVSTVNKRCSYITEMATDRCLRKIYVVSVFLACTATNITPSILCLFVFMLSVLVCFYALCACLFLCSFSGPLHKNVALTQQNLDKPAYLNST